MNPARYNPPQRMIFRARLVLALAALLCLHLWACAAAAQNVATPVSPFAEPAAALARQIASVAGPGPAKLTMRNASTVAAAELPVIRQFLAEDLRSDGVLTTGPETNSDSATLIRVTLSQDLQGGLWVAEIVEGTETRVVMQSVALAAAAQPSGPVRLTLRRSLLFTDPYPVLDAALFTASGEQRLIVLEPERIAVYAKNPGALTAPGADPTSLWTESQTFPIPHSRPFPRDLRGRILAAPGPTPDHLFDAYLPGVSCTGSNAGPQITVSCADSDDPWPITSTQNAFYNSLRDYFTGILVPGYGMDLAPFYAAAEIPRPVGSATLLNEVNGGVLLIANGSASLLAGTAGWGSDFAAIRSGCGSGAQLLVSGSGAATSGDSLRAFEIPAREAIPVSAPLLTEGAITSLSPAPGGTTAIMIVRRDAPTRYEVWNVAALCN